MKLLVRNFEYLLRMNKNINIINEHSLNTIHSVMSDMPINNISYYKSNFPSLVAKY